MPGSLIESKKRERERDLSMGRILYIVFVFLRSCTALLKYGWVSAK